MEKDKIQEYLRSKQFSIDFAAAVKRDTWGQGLPMIYMDDNKNIVEHWEDGTINILHTKEELDKKKNNEQSR
jgi:hypothetical protein